MAQRFRGALLLCLGLTFFPGIAPARAIPEGLNGQTSIQIVSLPEGRVLYEQNPNLALNPASNVKLITMAAAMHKLGPDFTFKTEFYSDSAIRNGRLQNLWIRGMGDPVLVTEEIESIADRFRSAGLKEIEGDIRVDDTYFDHSPLMAYMSEEEEKVASRDTALAGARRKGSQLYSIVTGSLSCDFNSIVINVTPARRAGNPPVITLDPPTRYLRINNQARTTDGRRSRLSLSANLTEHGPGVITIQGNIPQRFRTTSMRKGISEPDLFTGSVILEALRRKGIAVRGRLRREAVPPQASLIYTHASPPLSDVLRGMGKFSNNFIAEQLLKTLGAVQLGQPGTTRKGLKVLEGYLSSLGIRSQEFTLDNGSGLSRENRLSSHQLVRVLLDAYQTPWRESWISSLSVAGIDGTMRRKMRRSPMRGKIFAKTGTLSGVRALSGYALDGRRNVVFSFLFNHVSASAEKLSHIEEKILEDVLK